MDDGLGSSSQKGPKLEGSGPRWSAGLLVQGFPQGGGHSAGLSVGADGWGGTLPGLVRRGKIPKAGCEGRPEQFRPITCRYKLYTGALTCILMEHVERTGVLPEEQKALRKGRQGCLDAL